jgi:copper(I)-binding protein
MKQHAALLSLMLAAWLPTAALAQDIAITDAWARATVQGQKATGAFMTLTAKEASRLVAASSPVAGITEIHEMKMEKDVMRMSAVPVLALPAGQAVTLKPGGYHVMFMDLKVPLTDKSTIALTLTFENAKGQKSQQVVQVPVRAMTPMSTHKH